MLKSLIIFIVLTTICFSDADAQYIFVSSQLETEGTKTSTYTVTNPEDILISFVHTPGQDGVLHYPLTYASRIHVFVNDVLQFSSGGNLSVILSWGCTLNNVQPSSVVKVQIDFALTVPQSSPEPPATIVVTSQHTLSSIISNNTTLISNNIYYAPVNVTVNSSVTLAIQPGVKINFANNTTMIVNGAINAQGTGVNPILFTSATGTSAGSWNDVRVRAGNSIFKYCTFEYGRNPLCLQYVTSGNPIQIENCIFRYNSWYGLDILNSRAKIKSCQIYNNTYEGIHCTYSSDIDLIGNRIYSNGIGINSYSNNIVELYGNVIENNSNYGVSSYYGDIVRIGRVYQWWGYNTIRNNGSNEIHTSQYYAAIEISGASIHDASPWEVYNYPGNPSIIAQSVYWDTDGPQVSGNVNLMASIYWSLPDWDGQTRTSGSPIGKVVAPQMAGAIKWYWDPNISDYEKIEIGKDIISSNPESSEAVEALKHLYSIIRPDFRENILGVKDNFFNYLKEIQSKYSDFEIGNLANKYMILWKMLEGDIASVIELSKETLKYFPKEDRKWILTGLVLTYRNAGLINESRNALAELRANSNYKDEFISYLESDINEAERQIAEGEFKPMAPAENSRVGKSIPNLVGLYQNYPNPFNPETNIKFEIPELANVKLIVYDILGREIVTLENKQLTPGYYEKTWRGEDNFGRQVSSGIYLCRFYAKGESGKEYSKVMKMMMLK